MNSSSSSREFDRPTIERIRALDVQHVDGAAVLDQLRDRPAAALDIHINIVIGRSCLTLDRSLKRDVHDVVGVPDDRVGEGSVAKSHGRSPRAAFGIPPA